MNIFPFPLVDRKVYLSVASGHITSAMMHKLEQRFITLVEATSEPLVHLIVDARQVLSIPSLRDTQHLKYLCHPQIGYNITVGGIGDMRFMSTLSFPMAWLSHRDVASLDEACAFLVDNDPSLPLPYDWNIPYPAKSSAS